VLGTVHLFFEKSSELMVGVLFLLNEVHFSCSIILVHVRGMVLCLVRTINRLTRTNVIVCQKGSGQGIPGATEYENSEGRTVVLRAAAFEASENGGEFSGSAEETEGPLDSATEVEVMG